MKTTREGKRFIVASLLIAFAALNTGNNLIYLILSLMLAIILLAAVVLRSNLRGLALRVAVDGPVFAGETVSSRIEIRNTKSLLPTYSVRVVSPVLTGPLYFPFIAAGKGATTRGDLRFLKRGIYVFQDFSVTSGFPFILFRTRRRMDVRGEVVVYPALRTIDLPEDVVGGGGEGIKSVGEGDTVHSLREYRYGDDWRRIHWKASAKAAGLLVREYTEYVPKRATILLDNLAVGTDALHGGNVAQISSDARFEKMVSLTGSFARYFLERGYFVRMVSCKKLIPFGSGEEHLFKILDILAVVKEETGWDSPVSHEREGVFIAVLGSHASPLRRYAAVADRVIYADTV